VGTKCRGIIRIDARARGAADPREGPARTLQSTPRSDANRREQLFALLNVNGAEQHRIETIATQALGFCATIDTRDQLRGLRRLTPLGQTCAQGQEELFTC